ncbi:MAG: glycoside hydrolase family 16 protein [Burkholderiales bacterium]|nr:glycoside hydrolase family 16 protein [Burkholderiales bacterium]
MPGTRRRAVRLVLLAITGVLALAAPARPAPGAPGDVPPGYRLVWSDEFDVDGPPDPAKWSHDTVMNKAGWHNHERQYYAGPGAANAVVRGGRLRITARKETPSSAADWGGQHYTSARLLTRGKAAWTYGYFEVRAKMPCGRGTWPAIWTLGDGTRWPDEGELDIVEHLGRTPERVASAVHTAAGSGGSSVYGAQRLADACTRFHRYQMLWTPDDVSFGVDGFVHLHYPRLAAAPAAWPFAAPQFLLLNLAIGGDLGGEVDDAIFPVVFEIDYVRVYQRLK